MIATSENTVDSAVIERVKKLMRLASSDNQAEAELALQRARNMALEHDLELACIDAWDDTKGEEQYIQDEFHTGTNRKSVTDTYICWILQDHFNVRLLYWNSVRFNGVRITFIGKKSDVETAKYVYGFLNETMMRLWHNYRASNPEVTTSCRGSYFYGLQTGLSDKLSESRKQKETEKFQSVGRVLGDEAQATAESKYALICRDNQEKLKEAVKKFFPKTGSRSGSSISNSNSSVFSDGVETGRTISISKAIGNSQRALTF